MRSRVIPSMFLAVLVLTACEVRSEAESDSEPRASSPSKPTHKRAETRGDGAELLRRAGEKLSVQNPAFSPDGKTFLFTEFQGGYNKDAAALRVLPFDADAADRKPDTLLDKADTAAVNLPGSSWHPSRGVTFAWDREVHDEVWTLKPGGQPVRVTQHQGKSGYLEPSFSPDGEWISFQESVEREDGDKTAYGSIWKIRRDGSGQTRLLDGPGTHTDNRQPNWSPSEDKLVFQRKEEDNGTWSLFIMNADGSGMRRLVAGAGEHTDASWSPDGKSVVFSSTVGGLKLPQIFVIPAAGGKPVQVTKNDKSYDGAPSWSPDGKWIAFESHDGEEDRPTSLWRIPVPQR